MSEPPTKRPKVSGGRERKETSLQVQLCPEVVALEPEMIQHRRHFHQHPELSFQEVETAKYIAKQLRSYGDGCMQVKEGEAIVPPPSFSPYKL